MRISDWSSDVCSSDLLGDLGGEGFGKAVDGVEAGADRGAALGKLQQALGGALQALDAVGDLNGVAGEFLAEGQRRCVHQVGAADLDDAVEEIGQASGRERVRYPGFMSEIGGTNTNTKKK